MPEDNGPSVRVAEDVRTFSAVAVETTEDPAFRERLVGADVLILPSEVDGFDGRAFPSSTKSLFRLLQGEFKDRVEIATDSDSPPELVLHGDLLNLAVLLVREPVVQVLIGVISCYVYDWLRAEGKKPEKVEVRSSLVVQKRDGTSVNLTFAGPASTFEETVRAALSEHSSDSDARP